MSSIWPPGTATCELTWGSSTLAAWLQVSIDLGGTDYIRHLPTGLVVTDQQQVIARTDKGQMGSLFVVPVDDPNWVDSTGAAFSYWAYDTRLAYYNNMIPADDTVLANQLQPLTGQPPIDLDTYPQGNPGGPVIAPGGGSAALSIPFTNSSQWSYTHGLGRVPGVLLYDDSIPRNMINTQRQATTNLAVATFPEPTSGIMVLI